MKTLLSLLAGILLFAQPAQMMRSSQLEVGPGSGEVLIADVNRDGHVDIVTKHLLQRRINVSFGDGDGRFPRSVTTELTFEPGAIALGDMSADGIPDLVIASRREGAEFVEIWSNDGSGRFQSGPALRLHAATAYYKPMVYIADVTEDGRGDLIVGNGRGDRLVFVEGSATRGLRQAGALPFPARLDRHYVELADVNGDRHIDIITSGSAQPEAAGGQLIIALGDGRGRFAWRPAIAAGKGPRIAAFADMNGDGRPDAIVSHPSAHLSVLINDGSERFSRGRGWPIELAGQTHAVAVADLNEDGRPDLAAATAESVTVLLNSGGRFVAAPGSPFRAGPGAYNLAVVDLNKDRKLDIVASSFEGKALTLLFGR